MIEVTPVMDGPDYSGPVEVDLEGLDLEAWSGGSAGVFFVLDAHAAGVLFGKLGDAIKVIEANQDPEGDV